MAPTFTKITPSLPVTSVPESIKYYTESLGFHVAGRDGNNHTWLQLGSVNVYLRRRTFPDIPDDVAFGKVHIRVEGESDELEKLFEQYERSGVTVLVKVTHKPWGLKNFAVTDPDKNILNFDQVIAGWKPPAGYDRAP